MQASSERHIAENLPSSEGSSPVASRHHEAGGGDSSAVMGSTDSAGGPLDSSGGGGGSSCSSLVNSLFPSSCRGRAEAFARRLHRRLTSLGVDEQQQQEQRSGSNNGDATETTWLHGGGGGVGGVAGAGKLHVGNNCRVTDRQPRCSLDYDLELELELDLGGSNGPTSPQEEITEAEMADMLLMNPPASLKSNNGLTSGNGSLKPPPMNGQHRSISGASSDLELSDYASPAATTPPDGSSDVSDVYYDPEMSDTDKFTNSEAFYDPAGMSDSEATSKYSNGIDGKHVKSSRLKNGSSDESSNGSTNGKSSQEETNSVSHDSLWSTFDENTLSSQEENGLKPLDLHMPKSHSDSEILNGDKGYCLYAQRDVLKREREEDGYGTDEVDFKCVLADMIKSNAEYKGLGPKPETMQAIKLEDIQDGECSYDHRLLKSNDEANSSDTDTDHSTYSSHINIPGQLTKECPFDVKPDCETLKNEVQLRIEDGVVLESSSEDDKMCQLLKKLESRTHPDKVEKQLSQEEEEETGNCDDYDEEEEDRPQRIRRCSSLKTGKTPPGTPGRKKIVRFADVLGLDLTDVRTFLDEIPKIPNSAYDDLIYDDVFQKDASPVNNSSSSWSTRFMDRCINLLPLSRADKLLVPMFQQPGGLPNFVELIKERQVCLESALVKDTSTFCIQGSVRVRNLDFHKSVHVRYTLNSWQNYSDLQATYVCNSCDGFSDKFTFVIYCHTLAVGQRLEFAVRFQCKGSQYWDNNRGSNYCFQCLPPATSVSYPTPQATTETHSHQDWTPVFY